MPTEKPTKPIESAPSSFATRRAEREASGESQPERRRTSFRAGIDEPQPNLVITSVRA